MLKKISLSILLLCPLLLSANPKPFELEINKSTINDLNNKYSSEYIGMNQYSEGKMFKININELKFDGLEEAIAIYSKDEVLKAILLKLPKTKFDYIFKSLESKYKIINKEIPFVGDKSAKFIDDTTNIAVSAPHMSFSMSLEYINQDFYKSFKKILNQNEEEKKKKERSQL